MQQRSQRFKKTITIVLGFLLMYSGLVLLLLPLIISAWPTSVILSNTPQIFGFEDDLNSVSSTFGTPVVGFFPHVSETRVVECQSGDYVRWDLTMPSKTIDLTFKVCWTKLPVIVNESLIIGQVLGLDKGIWQDILISSFYCDRNGYRGWMLWTGIPSGRGSFVSGDVVYSLETNRWYTIRITADLNMGIYRLYMDTIELASIKDVAVPDDVYINFFRLGAGTQGKSVFVNYYDDIRVSLLDLPPSPYQWSVRITSSLGGSTIPYDRMSLNSEESLTVSAINASGYVFDYWILDGVDYSANSTVTLPAQLTGTHHVLHAIFRFTGSESSNWLPLQVVALGMIGSGGYLLWSRNKRHSTKGVPS